MTQTPPSPGGEPEWYYMVGQQRLGPITTQAIFAMIQSGALNASSLVWHSGMEQWTPAGALPEFAYALSSSPNKEVVFGLTTAGLVVFIILLFTCAPFCWLPWIIDGLRVRRR